MSRAFVSEDREGPDPRYRFPLPPREDPGFPLAAARALLQGAHEGDSAAAEEATGHPFGDPALVAEVCQLHGEAEALGNDRLAQLAERFLRRAGAL